MGNNTSFLIRRGDGPWRAPLARAYESEGQLQAMLVESPQLIPGVGPIAVVDEFYVPGSGPADLVGVEPSGEITVVECKLVVNADIRRTVVGQILAYAAGIWQLSYEQFSGLFHRRAGKPLIEAVSDIAAESGIDFNPDEFARAITGNLSAARFRLCIVVDEITEELKGTIELLNTQTKAGFEVMLLELTHASDGDLSILVPQAYGLETAQLKRGSEARAERWTTADVIEALNDLCTPEGVEAVRRLMQWAERHSATYWHGRGQYPTVGVYMHVNGTNRSIFAVYADPSGPTAPRVSLSFGAFSKNMDEATVEAFAAALERLPELEGAGRAARTGEYKGYPNIPVDASLAKPGVAKALIEALDTHIGPDLK